MKNMFWPLPHCSAAVGKAAKIVTLDFSMPQSLLISFYWKNYASYLKIMVADKKTHKFAAIILTIWQQTARLQSDLFLLRC
jgi:hypothetical protein